VFYCGLEEDKIFNIIESFNREIQLGVVQSSTPEWYTSAVWYTFVYFIASPNQIKLLRNPLSVETPRVSEALEKSLAFLNFNFQP